MFKTCKFVSQCAVCICLLIPPVVHAQGEQKSNSPEFRTQVVLLGTSGGRTSWGGVPAAGISSAVVVNRDVYLVDFGSGWLRRFHQAGLGGTSPNRGLANLRAAFITHLHADHVVDYPALFLFGPSDGLSEVVTPVRVFGPGTRGALVPFKGAPGSQPPVVFPARPTPGTVDMTEAIYQAYASDINDNMRDSQKPDIRTKVKVEDIVFPNGIVQDPDVDPAPAMDPFLVYQDENVKVSAILVNHAPVFPSFAFRFDTADGSVVFSGDTSPSKNLMKLAAGVDVLVHEVIDTKWVDQLFPKPRSAAAEAKAHHLLSSHTAVEDVGRIAQESSAKVLVLQHLAPADTTEARWIRAQDGFAGRVIVGRDLLRIGVGIKR